MPCPRDLASYINTQMTLQTQATTATRTGVGVDLLGYDAAVVLVDVGLWTDGTHTVDIEDSDDNSSFADVAAGDLQGTEPLIGGATADQQFYEVGYIGGKRYVRCNVTVSGATTGCVIGAAVIRGGAKVNPA